MTDEVTLFKWLGGAIGTVLTGGIVWAFNRVWGRIDTNEKDIKDIRKDYVRRDDFHQALESVEKKIDEVRREFREDYGKIEARLDAILQAVKR